MAVGVPENEVFAAADAVLARGERPTVERVRLELGRGSPARAGGLLDQLWRRLSERLSGETRLPALPSEVWQRSRTRRVRTVRFQLLAPAARPLR